jgi:hypothetical protein
MFDTRRRKSPQNGQDAQVLRIETVSVMGDYPDRPHGLPLYVKGNQQRFFQQGCHVAEIREVNLGVGTYLRGVAV